MDVIKVDPFQNVIGTGRATATWRPPAPMSLHGFVFVLSTGTPADANATPIAAFNETHITSLKVKKGKDLIPGLSGSTWRDLYEHDGIVYDGGSTSDAGAGLVVTRGMLPVMFGDPTARTMRGKHLGNFDHAIYPGEMTLEVDIAGATDPILEAYALVMPPKLALGVGYTAEEAALHRAIIETTLQTSAAVSGKAFDIGLGSAAGALLKRLSFLHGGDMTRLTIKRRGVDIWEEIDQDLVNYLLDDLYARVPQANWYVYDAIIDGDYSEVKTTVDGNGAPIPYQVKITTSGAATISAYADVLTRLPLL